MEPWVVSGKYVVGQLLGRGSSGEVYAAEGPGGARVAIKFLHDIHASDPEVVARFSREAANAQRVRSKYVARVLEAGKDSDGRLWIAFEGLEGEPLDRYVKRMRAIAMREAGPIIQDVLCGLDAAHRAGVIHRDIKPANLFIGRALRDGALVYERTRILDFGISKRVVASISESKSHSSLTELGDTLGTPAFMAPEQCGGARGVDERADLYSVGAVAVYVLTGRIPFRGQTGTEILRSKCDEEAQSLEQLAPRAQWPAPIVRFSAKSLRRRPDERYGTAAEMLNAWRELMAIAAYPEPSTFLRG